jgi:hypothetical protein
LPYVFGDLISDSKICINKIIYNENLPDELKTGGIYVEKIPTAQQIPFKAPIMFINPVTRKIYFEYEDRPLTKEELLEMRLHEQEQAIAELSMIIASLMGGA